MSGIVPTKFVWMSGEFVRWEDAKIHVASHVLHYASGVFEGIRCYETAKGLSVFRGYDHMRRLVDSARIFRMDPGYTAEELLEVSVRLINKCDLGACYIRPLVYRGYHSLGVNPFPCPVDTLMLVWEWGAYLGEEAVTNGVDVMVSSWRKAAPDTFPFTAKSIANYANGQLIKAEAITQGFSEAIVLNAEGYVAEGSGENLFFVRDGVLYTPPVSDGILPGITRASVMELAERLGYTVKEETIPRSMLYMADELFFTGTAAEITPIRSVDRTPIGSGGRGPITEALQALFFKVLRREEEGYDKWFTPVKAEGVPAG